MFGTEREMNQTRVAALLISAAIMMGLGFLVGRQCAPGGGPSASTQPVPSAVERLPAVQQSSPAPLESPPVTSTASTPSAGAKTAESLVYFPFESLFNESPEGIAAASLLLRWLNTGDSAAAQESLVTYRALSERENFGGEYTTLQWLCEYILADEQGRLIMLENDDGRRFVEFFGAHSWGPLRDYLTGKYGLGRTNPDFLRFLDEIVRFNSPYRDVWEKTPRLMELLDLQPGMQVADIGAGAGYFSFRFAQELGPDGRVHAVEINTRHLDYLQQVATSEGLTNLTVVPTDGAFPDLPEGSMDRIFLCSAYQAVYLSYRQAERDAWVGSLLRALAPDGLLVISENEPVVQSGVVPYRGISVSQPLIEGQLLSYGLELVLEEQLVPQRYVLVMRKPQSAL